MRAETFNTIRAYIRYDTRAAVPLVKPDPGLMLAGDKPGARRTDAHMVTAAWTLNNKDLVGQVSLFNLITYFVQLSRNFLGVWRPLVTGHYFDHRTGRISLLMNTMPR